MGYEILVVGVFIATPLECGVSIAVKGPARNQLVGRSIPIPGGNISMIENFIHFWNKCSVAPHLSLSGKSVTSSLVSSVNVSTIRFQEFKKN